MAFRQMQWCQSESGKRCEAAPFRPPGLRLRVRGAELNAVFAESCRWEAIRVQAVSPAVSRLLGYDQAPAHSQRSVSVPVHHLPGLLPEPGRHAEAHEGPQAGGRAGRLEDRKDLSVRLLRLSEGPGTPGESQRVKNSYCWLNEWHVSLLGLKKKHLIKILVFG